MNNLAENKKGLFNFEILEKYQAGLKLTGPEVKAAKAGRVNLTGSYVSLLHNPKTGHSEAWLIGTHIGKYAPAGYSQKDYNPIRNRKLLLTKKEINSLLGKNTQKTLTIIPISVYTSKSLVKVEIALASGKKKFDKRETIKKREFERSKQSLMKQS